VVLTRPRREGVPHERVDQDGRRQHRSAGTAPCGGRAALADGHRGAHRDDPVRRHAAPRARARWYWQVDRGGPAERAAGAPIPPSFAFPENATPEPATAGWRPEYPDYLYLAFTNATAFSPTDTLPVRRWAELTLMVQAALSLVIAILVIARAINVLPG
jgi:hypothetical protein